MEFLKKYKYALFAALFAVLLIIALILSGQGGGQESSLPENSPPEQSIVAESKPEITGTAKTTGITALKETSAPESAVSTTAQTALQTAAPHSYAGSDGTTAAAAEQTVPLSSPLKTSVKPNTVKPQTEKPQTVKPQTVKPQTEKPQTVKPQTEKPQTEKPQTVNPPLSQTTVPAAEKPQYKNRCSFTIECRAVLDNMDRLDKDKRGLVPADGIIFSGSIGFGGGESVYDILRRVCGENGIQLEAAYTPAFGSSYIEGINNLYEFDCGSASGWIYKVNGVSPGKGCSSYIPKDGDSIEFCYNC